MTDGAGRTSVQSPTPEHYPEFCAALQSGELDVIGRVGDASNLTLFATVHGDFGELTCVYKPVRGERPLWDFPDGTLAEREVLAHDLAVAAGWYCVPPTVLRPGPLGEGMVQLWVGTDPTEPSVDGDDGEGDDGEGADGADDSLVGADELVALLPAQDVPAGWLPVFRARTEQGGLLAVCHADDPRLAVIAGFDAVVNNADRKAPHLIQAGDTVFGVDHGLSFHRDDKLRTILWGWAGDPLPEPVVEGLHRLTPWLDDDNEAGPSFRITGSEARALRRRVQRLVQDQRFPEPPVDRTPIPWPPL